MIFLALMLACKHSDKDSSECIEGPDYEGFTEGFLLSKCQPCHASNAPNRYGAPESVHFDNRAAAVKQAEAIRRVVLEAESMPPSGGVTEEERILLEDWLSCVD